MATTTSDPHDPLSRAYRVVRRLTPPDAPFPGLLARDGSDAVVLVDPDQLPDGAAREPDLGPHVLQPSDVARTPDGQLLVLPWCVDRAEDVVRRAETLTTGESITWAVSIRRGARALAPARDQPEPRGTWWVSDAGCPMFVRSTQEGAVPLIDASTALWALVGASTASAAVRGVLARLTCEDDGVERALFALGDPGPVELHPTAGRRADTFPRLATIEPDDGAAAGGVREIVRSAIARHIDGDLAASVSDALHGLHRRLRRSPRPRARRSLVFAGAVAAAVIGVGLLWPSAAPDASAGDHPSPSVSATAAGAVEADAAPAATGGPADGTTAPSAPATGSVAPAVGEPASALDELLRAATGCVRSDTCDTVFETGASADPAALEPLLRLPVAERSIELLDDLGGVAVLRVTATGGADSVVIVLVHAGTSWLIRDIRSAPLP